MPIYVDPESRKVRRGPTQEEPLPVPRVMPPKRMFMELKRTWKFIDGAAKGRLILKSPGRYEMERVPNPFGHPAPWLVIKGTLHGGAEGFWRDWVGPEWEEFEVIITEE